MPSAVDYGLLLPFIVTKIVTTDPKEDRDEPRSKLCKFIV